MKNCLLLGRKGIVVENVIKEIDSQKVTLHSGTGLEDVQNIFTSHQIDVVIMGAGIDLSDRLEIIKYIFETSNATSVHMKDWDSGPAGMMPFVNDVLNNI